VAMVHGAGAIQALLAAGEVDELDLHVVPVLLTRGRRLFDHLGPDQVELELVRAVRTGDTDVDDPAQHVLHLRYRVRS
jgi:dihydrofolate reductase